MIDGHVPPEALAVLRGWSLERAAALSVANPRRFLRLEGCPAVEQPAPEAEAPAAGWMAALSGCRAGGGPAHGRHGARSTGR
jgi:hypothetical protein